MLGLDGRESLAPICRLDQPVSLMPQKGDQEIPIGREAVNDQDGRDVEPPSGELTPDASMAPCRTS
jgi:hypothetical protein